MSDSFSNIKEGDEVFVPGDYNIGGQIMPVTRTTPTTFIVGHKVFYKQNGAQKGGGGWSRVYARIPTPEMRVKVMRDTTISMMRSADVHALSDEQLQAIRDILDQPRKQKGK